MSDASEHLAPVSYLPWATPAEPVAERSASPADGAPIAAEASRSRRGADSTGPREPNAARAADPGSGDRERCRRDAPSVAVPDSRSSPTTPTRPDPSAMRASTGSSCRGSGVPRSRSPRSVRCSRSTASTRSRSRSGSSATSASATSTTRAWPSSSCTSTARAADVAAARSCRSSPAAASMPRAARAAVDELDPEVERRNALDVAERRVRQLSGLDRQTAERRLSAFLQRRGYPGDVVREAVTAALSADGS